MRRQLGIGMGWMGAAHSRAYLQVRHRFADRELEPRLVACADEVAARRAAAQREYGRRRDGRTSNCRVGDDWGTGRALHQATLAGERRLVAKLHRSRPSGWLSRAASFLLKG